MREKIEQIIEQSFDVIRIGNKVYYTSKSKSDEKFKRRIEELLTLHGVVSSKSQIKTKQEIIDLIKEDIGCVFDQQIEVEQLFIPDVVKCNCEIPHPQMKVSENGISGYCANCIKPL